MSKLIDKKKQYIILKICYLKCILTVKYLIIFYLLRRFHGNSNFLFLVNICILQVGSQSSCAFVYIMVQIIELSRAFGFFSESPTGTLNSEKKTTTKIAASFSYRRKIKPVILLYHICIFICYTRDRILPNFITEQKLQEFFT